MSETANLIETCDEVLPVEVKNIANLAQKIEGAAAIIEAAHPEEARRFKVHHVRRSGDHWYTFLAKSCRVRARGVIDVIAMGAAEGPAIGADDAAFALLSELTPAPVRYTYLLRTDRSKACRALADQVFLLCSQFENAAAVVEDAPEDTDGSITAPKSFEAASADLLTRAGGSYSLTEAADQLGVTRQAVHKRVHSSTALGMMVDDMIQLPKLQFVKPKSGGKAWIVNDLGKVIKLFSDSEAGPWAALEFLIDPDPNMGKKPIDALKDGQVEAVVHAARSHLGLDEG